MSSPSKPIPTTPNRHPRYKSATPSSSTSTRPQCSDDPADYLLVKIHTAKCSICDKRNLSDEMRRCKGCTWQICRPCQIEREQKGRSLAHGNLVTKTPTKQGVRVQLRPLGAQAAAKDPEAEAALAKVKEEDRKEALIKKAKSKVAQEVPTPSSSTEQRKKLERKAKKAAKEYTSLEELAEDLDEEAEEALARDVLSPLGGAGSKRALLKDASSAANQQSPSKKPRMAPPQASKPLPVEWDMMEQQREALKSTTYKDLNDVRGIRPSQHPTLIKEQYGVSITPGPGAPVDQEQFKASLHQHQPTDHVRDNIRIPKTPRLTGEEYMEKLRTKVRKKLVEQYGWQFPEPAITPTPPTEPAEPADSTLRDLVDREARGLHHGLHLDDDQKAELHAALMTAGRKFGNEAIKSMPASFKTMVKQGLDLALEHLTDRQKHAAVAAVQKEAVKKLKEFEEEIYGAEDGRRPEHYQLPRQSYERST